MKLTSSDFPELVIPAGLLAGGDIFRDALAGSLKRLSDVWEPQDDQDFSYVPVAWAFREVVELVTVFLASSAVAPLSAGDVPLPGWRRSLWRVDFSDVSSGLLSWAVAYLPRRSRQNYLAASLLEFLFDDGAKHVTGEPRSYAGLVGIGGTSSRGTDAWLQWRDRFFGCKDLDRMVEMSAGVTKFLPAFVEMLPVFNELISKWSIEFAERSEVKRLILRGETSNELPPFITCCACPSCGNHEGLHILVAPRPGNRFLYREVDTGHLNMIAADISFKRRFFTNPPSPERSSSSSLRSSAGSGVVSLTSDIEQVSLVTESINDVREMLKGRLTAGVLEKYHLPIFALAAESGTPVPLELLGDPGFGARDGSAAALRLNGLLSFDDENNVSPRAPEIVSEVREKYPLVCSEACRQLALWAEVCIADTNISREIAALAIGGIATWVNRCQDLAIRSRVCDDSTCLDSAFTWLKEESVAGSSTSSEVILKVSLDWIGLFGDDPAYVKRVADLRSFRSLVYRSHFHYAEAREELDRALVSIGTSEELDAVKAKILGERAEINLALEMPGLAAEDAHFASDIWDKLANLPLSLSNTLSNSKDALLNLVKLTLLRSKALLALGHRSQAIGVMQKVADRNASPRNIDEAMYWLKLNLDLAELLREQGGSTISAAASRALRQRYEIVMNLLAGMPENSRVREARALALRGLIDGKDAEEAALDLKQSQDLLEVLILEGRKDLKPDRAEVTNLLSVFLERGGHVTEALEVAEQATALYEELVASAPLVPYRLALAKLWRTRGDYASVTKKEKDAFEAIDKTLALYEGLIEDGAGGLEVDYSQVLAMRAFLHVDAGQWQQAKDDFDKALQSWPKVDDMAVAINQYIDALHGIAQVNLHLGHLQEAVSYYDLAIEAVNERSDRKMQRILVSERVWILLDNGKFHEAIADFESLLTWGATDGDERSYLKARALAFLRTKQYEEALHDYTEILNSDPDTLWAQLGRGLAMLGLQDPSQAVITFRQILDKVESGSSVGERAYAVLAHGGLAGVHEMLKAPEQDIKREFLAASAAWDCDGLAKSVVVTTEQFKDEVGYFCSDLAYDLVEAGHWNCESGNGEQALVDLLALDSLLPCLVNHSGVALLNLRVRFYRVQALAILGRKVEAIQQAEEAIAFALATRADDNSGDSQKVADLYSEEILARDTQLLAQANEFVSQHLENGRLTKLHESEQLAEPGPWLAEHYPFLIARLSYYCGLMIVQENGGARKSLTHLGRSVVLLSQLHIIGKSQGEIDLLGIAYQLRGIAYGYEGDFSPGIRDLDMALNIFQDLQAENGSKGWEWEQCLTLLHRAVQHKHLGSIDSAVYDLGDLLDLLPQVTSSSHSWVRSSFVKLFAEFIPEGMAASSMMCMILGRIFFCEVDWSIAECEAFEKGFCEGIKGDLSPAAWPTVAQVALSLAQQVTRTSQNLRGGFALVSAWLEQAIYKADIGAEDAGTILRELDNLSREAIDGEIVGWPPNFGVEAKCSLADMAEQDGETADAVDLLIEARNSISVDSSAEDAARTDSMLDLKRAGFLIELNRLEEASKAIDRAEVTYDNCKNLAMTQDVADNLSALREKVRARGGVARDSIVPPLNEVIKETEEFEDDFDFEELYTTSETKSSAIPISPAAQAPAPITLDVEPKAAVADAIPLSIPAPEPLVPIETKETESLEVLVTAAPSLEPPQLLISEEPVVTAAPQVEMPEDIIGHGAIKALGPVADAIADLSEAEQAGNVKVDEVAGVAATILGALALPNSEASAGAIPVGGSALDQVAAIAACEPVSLATTESGAFMAEPESSVSVESVVPEKGDFSPEAAIDFVPGAELQDELKPSFDGSATMMFASSEAQTSAPVLEAEPFEKNDTTDLALETDLSEEQTFAPAPRTPLLSRSAEPDNTASPAAGSAVFMGRNSSSGLFTGRGSRGRMASSVVSTGGPLIEKIPDAETDVSLAEGESWSPQPLRQTRPVVTTEPELLAVSGPSEASELFETPDVLDVEDGNSELLELVAAQEPALVAEPEPEVEESAQEQAPSPAVEQGYNSEATLELIDQSFACLDNGDLAKAQSILESVGQRVSLLSEDEMDFAVMAAELEALHGVADEYSKAENYPDASRVVDYGCQLARKCLKAIDVDSWLWWGDVELLAGRLAEAQKLLDKASACYGQAAEIYLKILGAGAGNEYRIDAFQALSKQANTLLMENKPELAEKAFSAAIENGLQVVVDGGGEEVSVAQLHLYRGHLRMELNMLKASTEDFEWAENLFLSDTKKNGTEHFVDIAQARTGMAEALILMGEMADAFSYRESLVECASMLSMKPGGVDDSAAVDDLVRQVDEFARQYAGN